MSKCRPKSWQNNGKNNSEFTKEKNYCLEIFKIPAISGREFLYWLIPGNSRWPWLIFSQLCISLIEQYCQNVIVRYDTIEEFNVIVNEYR